MRRLDAINFFCGHDPHPFGNDGLRDAPEEERGAVSGAAEVVPRLILALRPGVVGELMKELHRRAIGLKAVGAHTEAEILPAHFALVG